MEYTQQELIELRDTANAAALEGVEKINALPIGTLQEICNGIGPASFPKWLRDAISALHPTLAPVAMIHDVDWHENNGSVVDFIESNARFKRNGYKMAAWRYRWFDPRRYIVRRQTRRFTRLLNLFGAPAYMAATKEEQ